MKAAVLVGYGGVDQLELRDVPEPATGPGQIKVGVAGVSINPIDWKMRQGMKRPGVKMELPTILGRDASGTVVEVGPGVTRFRVGDRVAGLVMGAYAERVVANEEAFALVPESLDLVDAAAVPLVALTGADPDRLASMLRAVAEGALVIPIARRLPLSEIREAQTLAEKGAGGKVLLRV